MNCPVSCLLCLDTIPADAKLYVWRITCDTCTRRHLQEHVESVRSGFSFGKFMDLHAGICDQEWSGSAARTWL